MNYRDGATRRARDIVLHSDVSGNYQALHTSVPGFLRFYPHGVSHGENSGDFVQPSIRFRGNAGVRREERTHGGVVSPQGGQGFLPPRPMRGRVFVFLPMFFFCRSGGFWLVMVISPCLIFSFASVWIRGIPSSGRDFAAGRQHIFDLPPRSHKRPKNCSKLGRRLLPSDFYVQE